jgi:hypothetical protein
MMLLSSGKSLVMKIFIYILFWRTKGRAVLQACTLLEDPTLIMNIRLYIVNYIGRFNLDWKYLTLHVDCIGWFNFDPKYTTLHADCIRRFNLDHKYSTRYCWLYWKIQPWSWLLDSTLSTVLEDSTLILNIRLYIVDCIRRFNLNPKYLTLHCRYCRKIQPWSWIFDSTLSIVSEDSTLPIRESRWKFAHQLGPELVRNLQCT